MKTTYLKLSLKSSLMVLFLCLGLSSWAQYTGIGTFTKITSEAELTDGYYVVTNEDDKFAMNNTHTTFFGHTAVTPSSGELTNPDASIVWKIETNGSGKTIYNEVIEKYVGWTSGNAASAEDAPADTNRWTFSYAESKWTVNNVATPVRQLSYNSSAKRFAAYGNNGQQELQLYKLGEIPTDPVLNASETEITGLGYMEGNTPASQSFSLNGLNLDPANGNITVTAPANFQVSTDDVSFNNSLNIAYTDGNLATTNVYVRLNSNLPIGTYNGDIEISGGGATTVIVNVEGIVTEFIEICGEEDFENSTLTASYSNGSFVGNNGITWTYVHARNHDTFPINNKGIMLRRADEPSSLTAEFSGGIGNFSVDTRKAFSNNNQRKLELVINGDVIQQFEPNFSTGEDDTIHTFTVENINVPGNITLTLRMFQEENENIGNQQIILDNISWTCYSEPTLLVSVEEIVGLNYGLGNGPSAPQSFTLSGTDLDGSQDVTLLADTGFEIALLDEDSEYSDELILPDYDGPETIIYVRMASGLPLGSHSGVILISGYDDEKEINVSGSVLDVPIITEADLNAQVGVPFSYQIIATDEPSNYSISSEELPAGLELDAETGIISGTPTIAGEFIFGVTAENESGTSQEAVFTIEIAKGIQTVTGLGNINASVEDASITLPTTTDQGFTIIYELELNPVAAITGNTLSFLSVGTIDFMAYTQDNDDNYEDYLEVFTINVTEAPTLNHLVISQIYGAGGNSGAIYNRDYVELYNPTNSSISLEEYSLQYASSSGAFNSKANLSGIVPPHSYFLIALGSGGSNGDALPSPDLTPTSPGILNLAASNGKIVLANSTDTVESPDSSNVVDFVGFGSANMYEGSGTAPAPSATKAIFRKENGAQDTDDNANDFIEGSPNPRNLLFNSVVWETTNEWTGTPSIDENVVILGNLNVTELNSFSAKTLTIINGSLDIEAGGSVTVAENIIIKNGTNETFVVENDANLIQLNANTSDNIGAITVQKNSSLIKHLDYTIWSSPVNEQGLKAFSPLTLWYRIYTYNGSQDEWSNVFSSAEDSDSNFVAGVGYMFRAPNNFETDPYVYNGIFTGIPQSGDITVTFNNIGTYQSIGNPYPSNIKIDGNGGFWNVNPNTGTLYFWTNVNPWDNDEGTYTGNNWATYNKTGGVAVPADNSSKVSNGIIPVGQGFVVETDGVISEVTFKNSMRTTNEGVFFKITNAEKHRLWLDLSQNDTNINQILIGYLQGATQEYDFGFDSQLFQYNGNALYSLIDNDSEQYTIQGRSLPFNDNDIVPLGFRTNNAGTFTISLANFDGIFTEGQNIYLKDNFTQTIQNLKTGDYTFVSEEGIFNNRFEIVYKESADLNVNNPDLNNKWLVYSKDGNFQIETVGFEMKEVVFYDMLGRVVYQKQVNGTTHTATQFSANGVLIVKVITTDNQVLTKKTIN